VNIRIEISIAFVVGCLGCSTGSPDDATTGHYLTEMGRELGEMEQALTAHNDEIAGATDLEHIWTLEHQHLEHMLGHMQSFDEAWLSLDACSASMHDADGATGFDTTPMAHAGDELRADVETHWHEMLAAEDVDAAWQLEQHYRSAMVDLFDDMHDYEADLTDAEPEGGLPCPMHSHAHGMMHH
jgi:hypothetical protein